ncbi:MAG: antibiotic biosynthesis monooxygenase [Noviherbaspirillum sp.]
MSASDAATLVVQHNVQATAKNRYEEWLKDIVSEAQRFPGHMGVNIIRPHGTSNMYTIVLRFDSTDRLDSWLKSETRKWFIEEIQPALAENEEIDVHRGIEYWFTPPAAKQLPAKPFKQFLITLSAIFPLTIVVPWILKPVIHLMPMLGGPIISNFVVASIIVYLMVYVIMPRYTRLVAKWLFA